MTYQIDQSGKIEQTNKDTVLCLANGHWDVVVIRARTKRQIQEILRRNGQIRNYVLFTFCAGLFSLIRRNLHVGKVVIDREYYGKEPVIKEVLTELLSSKAKNKPVISFGLVGKQSHAHFQAKNVTTKKKKPNVILSLEELLRAIKRTEVGKRLKDA